MRPCCCRSALTFDEGGNFINVIFSPLTLWDWDAHGNMLATLRANYHLHSADTIARDHGRVADNNSNFNQTIGATQVPTVDIDGDSRPTRQWTSVQMKLPRQHCRRR